MNYLGCEDIVQNAMNIILSQSSEVHSDSPTNDSMSSERSCFSSFVNCDLLSCFRRKQKQSLVELPFSGIRLCIIGKSGTIVDSFLISFMI